MSLAERYRVKLAKLLTGLGFPRDWYLIPLAAIIGVLGGLVAAGFDTLVEFSGHLFFGELSQPLFPGSRYVLIVILPVIGGLAVGAIQTWIARGPVGHGIPEVIESLLRKHGELPGRMGLFKIITSSLTIGSGGSAGVEGPIIQIGSVLGSVVARFVHAGREHMHTLVGCGAAAGLAAIFNAPIAGVLFVLEVLLRDFSLKTFMPIVVASVFGTATVQALLDQNEAIFQVPEALRTYGFTIWEIGPFVGLGLCCGLIGVAFTRTLYLAEECFAAVKLPHWLKPAVGAAGLGLLGLAFVLCFESPVPGYEPPVFYANGYRVIEALFNPYSYTPSTPPLGADLVPLLSEPGLILIGAMLAFKIVGTAFTLGSGGSGGIFAPSLFLGAALGAGVGILVQNLGLFPNTTPAIYALAGMAGMIAATAHCPLTAFLLVFEITRDYKMILPVMLVAILATACSQYFLRDSIYTLYLRERGIRVGSFADMTLLRRLSIATVPAAPAVLVHPQEPAQRLLDLAEDFAATDYVVIDDEDRYVGMIVGDDVRTTLLQREAIPLMIVGELMRSDLPTVNRAETMDVVLDKFSRHEVSSLTLVDEEQHVQGMITRARLMHRYQQALGE
jgi:CIC family chloride channel protein